MAAHWNWIALGALAVLSATVDSFQEPSQTPPVFRAGVDVVQFDVAVIDKDHRLTR